MTTLYKRFANENVDLLCIFDSITTIRENNGIKLILINGKNTYTLFLTKEYPFKMPLRIQYNGIGWKYYLYQDNTVMSRFFLNSYYNLKEYNIIDHDIWVPGIKIFKIIEAIDESIKIKTEIMYRLLCFKIKYKYECFDAYFESYLFYYDRSIYF